MVTLEEILLGVALPFGVAMVLLIGAALATRPWAAFLGDLAVAAGVVAGYLGLARLGQVSGIQWSPGAAEGWLPHIGGAAVVISIVVAVTGRRWIVWAAMPVLLTAVTWLTLRPIVANEWTGGEAVVWIGGVAFAASMIGLMSSEIERRVEGPVMPLVWLIVAGGASAGCVFGGSMKLAQLGGTLTAALAAMALVSMVRRGRMWSASAVGLPIVAALLINAHFYADLPGYAAIGVLLAPMAALPVTFGPGTGWRRRRPVWAGAAVIAGAVVIVAGSLLPSALRFIEDMREFDPYAY